MEHIIGNHAEQFHIKNTAIALGKFDGIHKGHQIILHHLQKEIQKKENPSERKSLVFTFSTHPDTVLKGEGQKMIYTSSERAFYMEKLGVDILVEYPFTEAFSMMSAKDFVTEILVKKLDGKMLLVGEDFQFGTGRKGDVALLKELGQIYDFEVQVFEKLKTRDEIISSTNIRCLLEEGHLDRANNLLGEPYFVYGEIVSGKQLGHLIGFPTANQMIPHEKITPVFGVYESRVEIEDQVYKGISNLGMKPTIEGERPLGLETYILDFDEYIYHQNIKVSLLRFIRKEVKFDSVEALKRQVEEDLRSLRCILK